PYYGYLPGAWDEVISWSDRGPTQLGVAKPDVVNIGSFAWSMLPVIHGLGDGAMTADIFGGTSEATPMTSGSVALLIAAYRARHGSSPSPDMVKVMLKNYARDLGHDPFTQGAGQVDIYAAVKAVFEDSPIAYTYDSSRNLLENTGLSQEELGIVLGETADAQLYTGAMLPGESKTMSVVLEGSGSASIRATYFALSAQESGAKYLDLGRAMVVDYATRSYYAGEGWVSVEDDTLYVNLSASPVFRVLLPLDPAVFRDADMVSISVYYPYRFMDPMGRSGAYDYMLYAGVELSLWADIYGYGVPVLPATARISYDIRLANVYHVDIGYPEAKLELTKQAIEGYLGTSLENTTVMPVLDLRFSRNYWYFYGGGVLPVHIVVQKYSKEPWGWISAPDHVELNGATTINVSVAVPVDAKPGIYEG
ncbi:MAG: S8 family serine peptidase, partial [Candidatus Korarchaeota archaeon]|nr:S8 family serine peptidase [Candidatus Korarchaeota archaeon]